MARRSAFIPIGISMTLPIAPDERTNATTLAEQVAAFDGFTVMLAIATDIPINAAQTAICGWPARGPGRSAKLILR
jgi:hypothetical protein